MTAHADKVLVVDNHSLILKYVAELLESNGYRVATAKDGLCALDMLEDETPDVIILDLVMPNIDGASMCRILRSDPRFVETPILILTATAAEEDCRADRLGADWCIAKGPFPEMGENILHALRHLPRAGILREEPRVLGLENLHPRSITRELLDAVAHLEGMLNSISDGIVEINAEGRILYINPAASTYFSASACSLLGKRFLDLVRPNDRKAVWSLFEADSGHPAPVCIEQGKRFLSIKSAAVETETTNRMILINDVTAYEETRCALQDANEALSALSRTDALTGIANRRRFDERLGEEWRRMRRDQKTLSLLLCDVDHFKDFNDAQGHPAGDACLRSVAEVLSRLARRPGDLAARYGGDEFALILPDTDSGGAEKLGRALQRRIDRLGGRAQKPDTPVRVSLSIGIACARPGIAADSPEKLLSLADNALYDAKRSGRNRMICRSLDSGPPDGTSHREKRAAVD